MNDEEPVEEVEYGLVMPFVVCVSKGGPYEDQAFVAGVQFGGLWTMAQANLTPILAMVYKELLPQIDLLAMNFGYTLDTRDHDEWIGVHLSKSVSNETVTEGEGL